MVPLALLLALGAVECACLHVIRRPGGGWTSAVHLVLLGAMVAMLIAPANGIVIAGVGVTCAAIVGLVAVPRLRGSAAGSLCGGQLVACSVATLTIVMAMVLAPSGTSQGPSNGMAGMSGMAGSSTTRASPPGIVATVVLALFALRAVLEAVRALRTHRTGRASVLRHSAATAGSLSMVVMCVAMGAL